MLRPYELAIALRYVRSRNKNRFISFISVISMAGIAVAVAVLIMVLSVMNGFESEVRTRILNVVAHGSIIGLDGRIADWQSLADVAVRNPEVKAVAQFVDGQAMLVSATEIRGVQLRGIDPESERRTSALDSLMVQGSLESLAPGRFDVVLGLTLASELGVKVGDSVIMLVSQGITTPAGIVPRMRPSTSRAFSTPGCSNLTGRWHLSILRMPSVSFSGDDVSGVRLAIRDP
ncbi:MAG: ABC transporter permease [Gammaproteobacteria bacterium]